MHTNTRIYTQWKVCLPQLTGKGEKNPLHVEIKNQRKKNTKTKPLLCILFQDWSLSWVGARFYCLSKCSLLAIDSLILKFHKRSPIDTNGTMIQPSVCWPGGRSAALLQMWLSLTHSNDNKWELSQGSKYFHLVERKDALEAGVFWPFQLLVASLQLATWWDYSHSKGKLPCMHTSFYN